LPSVFRSGKGRRRTGLLPEGGVDRAFGGFEALFDPVGTRNDKRSCVSWGSRVTTLIVKYGPRRPWSRRSKTASTVNGCSPVTPSQLEGRRVERIVELAPDEPELKRAWASFPAPGAERWEYLASELIDRRWIHIFVGRSHRLGIRGTQLKRKTL